ncbi:NAD(P)H-dependent flavin oxidoreductase [Phytoactinopolyspora halotolerans]|uniref:Probable nitronate monooxygenase n=1 Tax=Phytoactinopolyspora halotolerans TaxID=1981512 RepID=A0A6L9SK94_9ACTN|nr:nitronate monooxygenase [Phytoactinopolyspora halotolerans]NEE04520.1 nitronate monooxygenase [Phytoactinopolyspora halotolerans]
METDRPLSDVLGIELPIIQAPMAGAQDSELAAAVSNAGGLGSLPCAMLTPPGIRAEVEAFRSRSDGPVNLNFFCHAMPIPDVEREAHWRAVLAPYYDELGIDPEQTVPGPVRAPFDHAAADVVAEAQPEIVSFHFGLPSTDLLARVKATGARVLASATTVEEARWLEERGVDAIIAQGLEAGGHRGMFLSDDVTTQVGTMALVPQIVRAVQVPVIAAGGIADAAGVAAALALGAAGVQVGTAYLRCPESTIGDLHRQALAGDDARHTALANVFTGRPARGIVNRAIRELGPLRTDTPEFPLATAAVAPLRAVAERNGSADFSPLWAGQNAPCTREMAAGELTRDLARAFASGR